MNVHMPRQLVTGAALAGALAFVAACSSPSSSMNPTSPSATASAAGGAIVPEVVTLVSGRFTGGGFQISGGVKVTRGFTIHCDNRLTNNLEINWAGGNNFHMDKNSLEDPVICSAIPPDPAPPAAPVYRIAASAPGKCNGLPARISFILEDRGEPGTNDRAAFRIIGGGCDLTVGEDFIDGGNIQAHFDQPHKPRP